MRACRCIGYLVEGFIGNLALLENIDALTAGGSNFSTSAAIARVYEAPIRSYSSAFFL